MSEQTTPKRRAIAAPASKFEREQVEWLEPGRIPLAAVTLVVGDPGLGKSAYTIGLAANLSQLGATALVCTAEDSLTATVRPRLEACGGQLSTELSTDLSEPESTE
jgi:predicted ATP-dependent serine protease